MTRSRVTRCFTVAAVVIAVCVAAVPRATAHELRPGYLDMRETAAGEFQVLWKTPRRGDARLALTPVFSGATHPVDALTTRTPRDAVVHEWTLYAPALRGQTLRIDGLEHTLTDVLVRIEFADATTWTHRFTPRQTTATVPLRPSPRAVAGLYLVLGVEHILSGIDHLLFVLALLFIARDAWRLVKTITAFTVAHSITLTAATLGLVRVPQQPVEAVIALSIVFVAAELVHGWQGRPGVTARAPWLVALTFGLLHGLGFAGALSEVGLPQHDIPLALLFFSAGVEVGHFLFVGAVLATIALGRRLAPQPPRWLRLVPPYAIGGVAACWVFERIAAF